MPKLHTTPLEVVEYRKSLEVIDEAISWYADRLGGRVSGRILEYRRLMANALQAHLTGNSPEDLATRFAKTLPDLFRLTSAYKLLAANPEISASNSFLKILGGTFLSEDESQTSTKTFARDKNFELLIAAYLVKAGCRLLPELPELDETDGLYLTQDRSLVVECKRLRSPKQISKRFSSIRRQLKARQDNWLKSDTLLSMAFVDVTRLINPDGRILSAQTQAHAAQELATLIQEVAARSQNDLQDFSIDYLGTAFYADLAVNIRGIKLLCHAGQFVFVGNSKCFFPGVAERLMERVAEVSPAKIRVTRKTANIFPSG